MILGLEELTMYLWELKPAYLDQIENHIHLPIEGYMVPVLATQSCSSWMVEEQYGDKEKPAPEEFRLKGEGCQCLGKFKTQEEAENVRLTSFILSGFY